MRSYDLAHGRLPDRLATANDSLRELFKNGCIVDEKPFFYKGAGANYSEGDGDITGVNAFEALRPGENTFAYWTESNGRGISLSSAPASAPLLSAPMRRDTPADDFDQGLYDSELMEGQAVFLTADGAAHVDRVNSEGRLENGMGEPVKLMDDSRKIGDNYSVVLPVLGKPVK